MNTSTDRIERQIHLKAPRSRVWRALSNAEEFGTWFGVALQGQTFAAGQRMKWQLNGSCGHHDVTFDVTIERLEPEHLMSYRWHPYAVDPAIDYSQEPTTLVEFTLQESGEGTLLNIVESGFDNVPLARRLEAFQMNSGGWDSQLKNIEAYVATP